MPKATLPPGPSTPAWEQAKAWIERPIEFWKQCNQEYGDTFTVQFGSVGPTVLFCNPESIAQVFALPSESFECRQYNDHYRIIMGKLSLLTIDGKAHLEQRRVLAPTFSTANTQDWIAVFQAHTHRKLQGLQLGELIHVRRLVHELVFQGILELLFGEQQPAIKNLLERLFHNYILNDYGTWSPWARFSKSHAALRSLLSAEVRRLRSEDSTATVDCGSLFDRLVRYQHPNGELLSEMQIQDHIFTMLIAGVDPSALATTWTLYWIHQTPHVLARLVQELSSVEEPTDFIARNDHYLHATCQESLRMYPVVTTPSGRKLVRPQVIDGRTYPAGVTLVPCTYLAHRRKDVFDKPDRFLPERFMHRVFSPAEYFPFGGGRRACIGAKMGLLTLKVIALEMVKYSEFSSATTGDVHPIRHGTLLAPSDNFRMQLVGNRCER